jgi:hypothetical protein
MVFVVRLTSVGTTWALGFGGAILKIFKNKLNLIISEYIFKSIYLELAFFAPN